MTATTTIKAFGQGQARGRSLEVVLDADVYERLMVQLKPEVDPDAALALYYDFRRSGTEGQAFVRIQLEFLQDEHAEHWRQQLGDNTQQLGLGHFVTEKRGTRRTNAEFEGDFRRSAFGPVGSRPRNSEVEQLRQEVAELRVQVEGLQRGVAQAHSKIAELSIQTAGSRRIGTLS